MLSEQTIYIILLIARDEELKVFEYYIPPVTFRVERDIFDFSLSLLVISSKLGDQ